MSKKILSLALVVVMLMSMFAFSTSALDLTTGQIGLRVETDAYVGMPAGEIVEFKVYYVLPDDVDLTTYRQALGNIAVAYTDGFAINSDAATSAKDARTWGSHYAEFLKEEANVTITAAVSNTIVGNFSANDQAKGWDKALFVQQSYISGAAYKAATGYPVDPDCEIFTLYFKTTRTLTAEDSIGVPEGALGTTQFKMNYWQSATKTSVAYDKANVILTENTAYATAAAEKEVYHVKNQIQWADKAAGTVNLGVVAGFDLEDINIAFNEAGTSTNVASVGATVVIGDKNDTKTERFVYSANNGASYYFRVVIAGVAKDYTGTITVTPFVTMNDAESTTYYADAVTIDAAGLATMVGRLPA